MRLHRQHDVLQGGEFAENLADLVGAAQAQEGAGGHAQARDVAAVEMDAAFVGMQFTGELRDQGGLAGAVGTDDGVDFAGRDLEVDVVGGRQPAEALDQFVDGEQRAHWLRPPRAFSLFAPTSAP